MKPHNHQTNQIEFRTKKQHIPIFFIIILIWRKKSSTYTLVYKHFTYLYEQRNVLQEKHHNDQPKATPTIKYTKPIATQNPHNISSSKNKTHLLFQFSYNIKQTAPVQVYRNIVFSYENAKYLHQLTKRLQKQH